MANNINRFTYGELSKSMWGDQNMNITSLGVRIMENMHATTIGSARKRNGSIFIKSYDQEIRAIKINDIIVVILDTNEYEIVEWKEQGNTLQVKQSMPTDFDFDLFDTSQIRHTLYNEKFIIGQSNGAIIEFTYSTKTFSKVTFSGTGQAPSKTNIYTSYHGRMVYAVNDTLYFSDVDNPYRFTNTSPTASPSDSYSIKISNNTNSVILDIMEYRGFLIIATDEYIYTLINGKISPLATSVNIDPIKISRIHSLGMKIKSFRIIKDLLICIGTSGIFALTMLLDQVEQQDLTIHCKHLFEKKTYKKISKYYAHDEMFFTLRDDGVIIAFTLVNTGNKNYMASGSRYIPDNGEFIDFDLYSNTIITKYNSKYFLNKFVDFDYTSDNNYIRNVTDDEIALGNYHFFDSCITSGFTGYSYAKAIATHKIKFNSSQLNFSKNDYVYIKYIVTDNHYIKTHDQNKQFYENQKYEFAYIKIVNNIVNNELIINDISFILDSEVIILGKDQPEITDATLTNLYGNENKYNLCISYIDMNNGNIPFLNTMPLLPDKNNQISIKPRSWFYIIGLCYHGRLDLIPYNIVLGNKTREINLIKLYSNKLPVLKLLLHDSFNSLVTKKVKQSAIRTFKSSEGVQHPYTTQHIHYIGGNDKWEVDFNVSFIIPSGYSGELDFIMYNDS